MTNRFLGQIGHFTTKINPVITNPDYNEQKGPVASYLLQPSLIVAKVQTFVHRKCGGSENFYNKEMLNCFIGFPVQV